MWKSLTISWRYSLFMHIFSLSLSEFSPWWQHQLKGSVRVEFMIEPFDVLDCSSSSAHLMLSDGSVWTGAFSTVSFWMLNPFIILSKMFGFWYKFDHFTNLLQIKLEYKWHEYLTSAVSCYTQLERHVNRHETHAEDLLYQIQQVYCGDPFPHRWFLPFFLPH